MSIKQSRNCLLVLIWVNLFSMRFRAWICLRPINWIVYCVRVFYCDKKHLESACSNRAQNRSDVMLLQMAYNECAADGDWRWLTVSGDGMPETEIKSSIEYITSHLIGPVWQDPRPNTICEIESIYAAECNEWRVICIFLSAPKALLSRRRPRTSIITFVSVFFILVKMQIIGWHQCGII